MRRLAYILLMILTFASIVQAQDPPPVVTEELVPSSQPQNIFGEYLSEMINLRNDLELLATAVGGTVRPDGWNGNLDVTNPQLPLLIRTDMELLVADKLGFAVPQGWFGIVLGATEYQARDLRHDLELLADALMGAGNRPNGWAGNPIPIWKCSRSTQTLARLLGQGNFFNYVADPADPNFCAQIELQVVGFVEQNLFTIDTQEIYFTSAVKTTLPGSVTINSDFAVGFYDITATRRAGVIPNGTPVTPLGRSPVQFSRMALFEGDGFLLFVEYPFTSLTEEEFKILGDPGVVATTCNQEWCSG